ncbi:MAG: energy transducer TonB [Longimicrobiales bacterium]
METPALQDVAKDVQSRRKDQRKIWRNALIASFMFHLFIFLTWRGPALMLSPFAAAGPKAGDSRAAAGGMQQMNVLTPPSEPIRPPRLPLEVTVEIEPVEMNLEPAFDAAAVLGEQPGPPGPPGIENGDGQGDGGTAAEGLRRMVPPMPRGMIIPPTNKELRGTEVEVWVFVNERGKVVPDSTRLRPPTKDRGFNRRLIREAAQWVFTPGKQDGKPVASWFPYTISM